MRKKQHDFKSVHYERKMVLFALQTCKGESGLCQKSAFIFKNPLFLLKHCKTYFDKVSLYDCR